MYNPNISVTMSGKDNELLTDILHNFRDLAENRGV
jgi:hypothetical protein